MGTSIKHPVPILCQTGLTRSGTGCFIAHAATVGVKGFSSSYVRRTGANAQFVNGIALSFGHFSAWIVTCISWGFASFKFIGSDASRDVCKICDFARNSTRLAVSEKPYVWTQKLLWIWADRNSFWRPKMAYLVILTGFVFVRKCSCFCFLFRFRSKNVVFAERQTMLRCSVLG